MGCMYVICIISLCTVCIHVIILPPEGRGIKRRCASDVCRLSVAYIWPKSRTERPRKNKIGTEVDHVTRDSDTTFKVKGQLAGGGGVLWRPPAQLVTMDEQLDELHSFSDSLPYL